MIAATEKYSLPLSCSIWEHHFFIFSIEHHTSYSPDVSQTIQSKNLSLG